MSYPNFEMLKEYTHNEYVPDGIWVFHRLTKLGKTPADYRWTTVFDGFKHYRVIAWLKNDGRALLRQDVFEPDEDEESDIAFYLAGQGYDEFDPEIACQDIHGSSYCGNHPEDYDDYDDFIEYNNLLADIIDSEDRIVKTARFWLESVKGQPIPNPNKERPVIWDIDWFAEDDDSVPDNWVIRKI